MRIIVILLFAIVVGLIAAVFGGLNDQSVTVDLIFTVQTLNLAYLLLATFFVGLFLGLFAGLALYFPKYLANLSLNKTNTKLKQELTNLRSLPIRDDY
ncbi:MAG: LapA family protein [Pseudomonadota bacterium]